MISVNTGYEPTTGKPKTRTLRDRIMSRNHAYRYENMEQGQQRTRQSTGSLTWDQFYCNQKP
jgi:hypothetical protein